MARFTKGKGWRVIAFLRVPIAMDVAMDILPLEKIFGGVSKCPRNICAETAVRRPRLLVLTSVSSSDGELGTEWRGDLLRAGSPVTLDESMA